MKVLVAEDEPLIARHYQMILGSRGHDVRVCVDGLDALEAYEAALSEAKKQSPSDKVPFDVVILDYRMPKKDGLETAREIIKLCPKQRIIFASAYVRETLRESTKELHQVVELLQKPFDLSYLVEVVERTNVYNQLMKLNVNVEDLKNRDLTDSESVKLLKSVQDALQAAASVKLSDSEMMNLLESLKELRGALSEA
jgi:CheY-like chemotaxis protein